MTTTTKLLTVVAIAAALFTGAAYASGGTTSNLSANVSATVITPVTITQQVALSFGTFAVNPSSGGGTIDSSGNVTGGVNKVVAGTPATFNTAGVAGNNYTVVCDNNVTLNGNNAGSAPMNAVLTYPIIPRALNGTGTDSFQVSGILTAVASQQADTYSGTYNISVHY
jgi:Mat/Ecp fimbriae major subunit